jgi:hypothetical protein
MEEVTMATAVVVVAAIVMNSYTMQQQLLYLTGMHLLQEAAHPLWYINLASKRRNWCKGEV